MTGQGDSDAVHEDALAVPENRYIGLWQIRGEPDQSFTPRVPPPVPDSVRIGQIRRLAAERERLAAAPDWRGDWVVASVPALDGILAEPGLHWRVWELTRDARDTARWLLAVRSHRWVAETAVPDVYSEDLWWLVWRGVLALRWALSQRSGPPEGFLSSTEVALRPRFGVDHLYRSDLDDLLAGYVGEAGGADSQHRT